MQRISTKSRIYLMRIRVPRYFYLPMLELESNAHLLPSKKIQKMDIIRMILASIYSRHEVVCVTCFRVNNQSIGVDSLFINSDLRSILYYQKKIIVYAFYIDVNIRLF